MISIGIASINSRSKALCAVLASLLDQTVQPDRIFVQLNNYEEVPVYLQGIDKLHYAHGPDMGTLGKFADASQVGYRLTCDDDIIYPRDYVERMIEAYERHRCLICVQGATLPHNFKSYRLDRYVVRFYHALRKPKKVLVPGSGTLCWHTDLVNIEPSMFERTNCDDPQLGLMMHDFGIDVIAIERRAFWLKSIAVNRSESIGARLKQNDAWITSKIKSSKWHSLEA